jgi:hypothetical protein
VTSALLPPTRVGNPALVNSQVKPVRLIEIEQA